jgi:hypothetical protein
MEDRVNEIEARAEAVSELYDEKTELDKGACRTQGEA